MSDRNLVSIAGNRIKLSFEPDPDRLKAIRLLASNHGGAQVKPANGVWNCCFPLTAKDEIALHFGLIKWSDEFRALMQGSPAKFQTADESITRKLLAAAGDLSEPLTDGRKLFEHQRTGIEWLLKVQKGILADDMGLGKTLQSLLAAKAIYEATRAHTVVITKACLVEDWRDEARKIGHRVVSVYSWAKIPKPSPGSYVLIADEAQYAQSLKSQRGTAFQEWATVADWVFPLSGTPMINGAHANLFPLLKAIGHPLGTNKAAFEKRYCGKKRVTYGKAQIDDETFTIKYECMACHRWNTQKWHYTWKTYTCSFCNEKTPAPKSFISAKGTTNADELKKALAPVLLRRLKTECIDLPPKTRVIRRVEITSAMHDIYSAAVQRAKASYMARVRSGEVATHGLALAMLTYIREAASIAKVEAAVEIAEEVIEAGGQPIIFTEFVQSAVIIAKHFKITPFIGATKNKGDIVKAFQAGDQIPFVGTRESGGTGLTLTAGNTIISVDQPMRPGDDDQAEDRAARIGQRWPLTCLKLRAFPVCDKIGGFLDKKRAAIQAVLGDGAQVDQDDGDSAREIIGELFDWAKVR